MGRLATAVHAVVLSSAAAALCIVSACSEQVASGEAAAGSGGLHLAGSAGTSGKGASSSGAGASSSTQASSAGGEESRAGNSGTGNEARGGAGAAAGGAPVAGGADAEPPGPAPGGGAVYAVECSGDTAMCGVERAHCLGINLDQGGVGYACSNQCNTIEDCSDAPSGAAAEVGCVQFTKEKRCVLVCYDQPNRYACPSGMGCYVYPNSPIGYCLWMK